MGLIRIYQGKSKPAKRKPGWAKAAQEYAEWQSKVSSMTSGIRAPKTIVAVKPTKSPSEVLRNSTTGIHPQPKYVIGSGTKPVHRPDILYRENPEMLQRELAARERKFNVAPAFNKGGDQFVTEESLQQLLSSNKRRS